jgi:hypothetical protein
VPDWATFELLGSYKFLKRLSLKSCRLQTVPTVAVHVVGLKFNLAVAGLDACVEYFS